MMLVTKCKFPESPQKTKNLIVYHYTNLESFMKCVCVSASQHHEEQDSLGKEKTTASKEIIWKNKGVL